MLMSFMFMVLACTSMVSKLFNAVAVVIVADTLSTEDGGV